MSPFDVVATRVYNQGKTRDEELQVHILSTNFILFICPQHHNTNSVVGADQQQEKKVHNVAVGKLRVIHDHPVKR